MMTVLLDTNATSTIDIHKITKLPAYTVTTCMSPSHQQRLNRELFKGRRSLEPVGSRTITVEHVELQVG